MTSPPTHTRVRAHCTMSTPESFVRTCNSTVVVGGRLGAHVLEVVVGELPVAAHPVVAHRAVERRLDLEHAAEVLRHPGGLEHQQVRVPQADEASLGDREHPTVRVDATATGG